MADDELAPAKHEYFEGVVDAMAGSSLAHSSATTQITVAVHKAFAPRGCRIYYSDARVRITEADGAFYPDVTGA